MEEVIFGISDIHFVHFFHVFVYKLNRALKDFRRSGDLSRSRRRETKQGEKITWFSWLL